MYYLLLVILFYKLQFFNSFDLSDQCFNYLLYVTLSNLIFILALPTELPPDKLAGRVGIEPTTKGIRIAFIYLLLEIL